MAEEILNHLRELLGIFGAELGKLSPWKIPWPLTFALVFPLITMVLAVAVWLSRGRAWPVWCDYPKTTTGHPCRNRVLGEWKRCHHHRPGTRRRNGKVVQGLLRWETVHRGGRVVERNDIRGRGFLRNRSQVRGLLYYRGFARPPRNVALFWWTWLNERRDDLAKLLTELREGGSFGLRTLFTGSASISARVGVSSRLPQVIRATRLTLLLVAAGLSLVGTTVWLKYGPNNGLNYAATFMFVAAWEVVRSGIWGEATAESRPARQHGWFRMASTHALWAFIGFMLVSVLAGNFIDKTRETFGG